MTPAPGRLAHLVGLDGLRAVAVLAVVLFHGGVGLLPGGFLGVDVFFVLSGFLITSLLLAEHQRTSRIDLRAFWIRRARRLLPAVLAVLLGVAIYAAVLAERSTRGAIRLDSLASLFYVANWRFIASGDSYFATIAAPSPVRHLWSLAVEEQWYLIWPVAVALLLRGSRGRRRLAGLIGIAALGSTLLMALLTFDGGDTSRAYYGTDTRVQTLLVGAGLALVLRRVTIDGVTVPSRWRRALGAAAVVAGASVVLAFVLVDEGQRWMYQGGFAGFAVMTAMVIAAAVCVPSAARALAVAPLRWVGTRSYAIYLWHWPLALTLSASRTGLRGWPRFALLVLATFTASELSFRFVEQPVRLDRIRFSHPGRVATTAVLATAALVVLATLGSSGPPAYAVATGETPIILEPATTTSTAATASPSTTVAGVEAGPIDAPADTQLAPVTTSPPPAPPPRPPSRVLLLGDSIAYSLQDALGRHLVESGVAYGSYAVPGCGVVTGTPVAIGGALIENCGAVAQRQRDGVSEVRPDLVVVMSAWETSDRKVGDTVVREGTPEFRQVMLQLYDEMIERATKRGARVAFVLNSPSADGANVARDLAHDEQLARLNDILREVANRHAAAVTVISLADVVCPEVPCPNQVDGVAYRPIDGSHFEMPGADAVAAALAERIAALDLDSLPAS